MNFFGVTIACESEIERRELFNEITNCMYGCFPDDDEFDESELTIEVTKDENGVPCFVYSLGYFTDDIVYAPDNASEVLAEELTKEYGFEFWEA